MFLVMSETTKNFIEENNNVHLHLQADSSVRTNLKKQKAIKTARRKVAPRLKRISTRNTISLKDRKANSIFLIIKACTSTIIMNRQLTAMGLILANTLHTIKT